MLRIPRPRLTFTQVHSIPPGHLHQKPYFNLRQRIRLLRPRTSQLRANPPQIQLYLGNSLTVVVQPKYAIEAAWYEASLLDQAQQKYVPGGAFSTAMINYFGNNVGNTGGFLPWDLNFRKIIGDNIARRHALDTNNAPRSTYLYFYCYDWYQSYCTNYPSTAGYTHNYIGTFWTNHYITLCDLYFTKPTLMDTIRTVSAMPNSAAEKNILENFYINRATILYHETYHLKDTVVQPNTKDYANLPQGIWEQAKLKGAYWSYVTRKSTCRATMNDYLAKISFS